MPVTVARAAGWYADPDDASLIRYWDGRQWTDRRRPRPSWAGAVAPDTRVDRRRHRRMAILTSIVVVVALALASYISITAGRVKIPARSVGDTAFTSQADAVCRRMLTPLRQTRPQPGKHDDPGTPSAVADRIDATASTLSDTAGQLRSLPVAAADHPRVEHWLGRWDDYIGAGRRYAAALRTGNEREYTRVAREGAAPEKEVYVFARANGMAQCSF